MDDGPWVTIKVLTLSATHTRPSTAFRSISVSSAEAGVEASAAGSGDAVAGSGGPAGAMRRSACRASSVSLMKPSLGSSSTSVGTCASKAYQAYLRVKNASIVHD